MQEQVYRCPHAFRRSSAGPGQMPEVRDGPDAGRARRLALLRHMFSSPLHLGAMAVVMVAVMAAAMMMMR